MKVFIAGYDVMGRNMAGPGIRSLEIARFLSVHADVTLSFDEASDLSTLKSNIELIPDNSVSWDSEKYWKTFDMVIFPGSQALKTDLPDNFPTPLIVDLYDPFILENIFLLSGKPKTIRDYEYMRHLKAMIRMFMIGDRFIITGERALDFFTGMLISWGVINPDFSDSNTRDNIFLEIPFAIPDDDFEVVSKGRMDYLPSGLSKIDELILWAGGLWDWLNPLALIEIMPRILKRHPMAKLYFPGYKHPNKHVPVMEMALKCIETSKKLGLFGKSIIFKEWTPYQDRIPLLAIAKAGVSLHKDHIETRYSFRTRVMDYIWAGIPMVLSSGDYLSYELSDMGLAELVESDDPDDLFEKISDVLFLEYDEDKPLMDIAFHSIRAKYRWSEILKPLLNVMQNPPWKKDKGYHDMFMKMYECFPTPPKPGMLEKGIEKIKKRIK
jgi:glycosyltransferase involved in cell wall biosynthesis